MKLPHPHSDLFRKRSYRKSKRRACSPLGGTCLSGNAASTNPNSPVGPCVETNNTPPVSTLNRWVRLNRRFRLHYLFINKQFIFFSSFLQSKKVSRFENVGEPESERTVGSSVGSWFEIEKLWEFTRSIKCEETGCWKQHTHLRPFFSTPESFRVWIISFAHQLSS